MPCAIESYPDNTYVFWWNHYPWNFTDGSCDYILFTGYTYLGIDCANQEEWEAPIGPVAPPLHGPKPEYYWYSELHGQYAHYYWDGEYWISLEELPPDPVIEAMMA